MEFDLYEFRKKLLAHPRFPLSVAIVRGILSYACFGVMQAIVLPIFRNSFYKNAEDVIATPATFVLLCEILLSFLMLNTVIGSFAIYHRMDRETFLSRDVAVNYDRKAESQMLWRNFGMWVEIGVFILGLLLFGSSIRYSDALSVLPIEIPSIAPKAFLFVTHAVVVILLRHFSAMDARDYWLDLPRRLMKKSLSESLNQKKKSKYSYWRLVLRLILAATLYSFGASILTVVLAVLLSMIGVVNLLLLTPGILAILLLIVAVFYLRTFVARVKLIRKLKKVCKERGYELFDLKRPYRSIFRDNEKYTFAVSIGKTTYYCRLIACINRGNKYTFSDDGILTRVKMIHMPKVVRMSSAGGYVQMADYGTGDDLELFGFSSEIDYTFEADGEKILLLNPTPRRVLKKNDKHTAEMDNGDKIGEYSVYTGNAFLRLIDRLGEDRKERIFHDR